MAADSLAELLGRIEPDPWRKETGFSPDIQEALGQLVVANSDSARESVFGGWLERHQPCLFGRIAAQRGLISYCTLTNDDLDRGDDFVRTKIQADRTRWSAAAHTGARSGFVIAVTVPELAAATPNATVAAFAKRLCSLYLLMDDDQVAMDEIYLDDIRLEAQLPARPTWQWDVGVNYFSAQGDQRWWHDHRIPAGMAFSMNSVGHMVKATQQSQLLTELEKRLNVESGDLADSKLDSLNKALRLAMMTIDRAADAVSGHATWLLPNPGPGVLARCPIDLPAGLADKNHCEYAGYYHTDATLPSVYFRPDVERADDVGQQRLDFSYLNEFAADRIDWLRAGVGRRVRESSSGQPEAYSKRNKAHPRIIDESKDQ